MNNNSNTFTQILSSSSYNKKDHIIQSQQLKSSNLYNNAIISSPLPSPHFNNINNTTSQSPSSKHPTNNIFHLSQSLTSSKPKKTLVQLQLQSLISKLHSYVHTLDDKIQNRVQLVKHVYLNQYKSHIVQMSLQLKTLKQKLDNQVLKQKANQKMFYLQQQRDFFRSEVLKLNQQMNKINKENKLLKRQIEEEKRQKDNYKQIVYNLENKLIKIKSNNVMKEKLLQDSNKDEKYKAAKTERLIKNTQTMYNKKSMQTFDNTQQKQKNNNFNNNNNTHQQQFTKTSYRLRPSQSLKSHKNFNQSSSKQQQTFRLTGIVSYPKLTTQHIKNIQGYQSIIQHQQIIDSCLNEVKKQIYYRNLSSVYNNNNNSKQNNKIHFNEENYVKFEKFTKTDKKELIVKILTNQKLLNQFYQFLFKNNNNIVNYNKNNKNTQRPSQQSSQQHSHSHQYQQYNQSFHNNNNNNLQYKNIKNINLSSSHKFKLTSQKFNTKMLNNMKTEFNKKIFDIKYNNINNEKLNNKNNHLLNIMNTNNLNCIIQNNNA